jgi:hypothetical protein
MTIAASGAISLTDLQTEFGGPTPIALQNYYRGGTYVTDVAQNAAVPTSGAISLLSFYGTTREVVSILDVTVSDDQPSPRQPQRVTRYAVTASSHIRASLPVRCGSRPVAGRLTMSVRRLSPAARSQVALPAPGCRSRVRKHGRESVARSITRSP